MNAASCGRIIGATRALRQVLQKVDAVASTDATVLIIGESGTGKELLAEQVHRLSARAARPFIRVNCSAIPREMFESEFFGHVRGAFTGAMSDRPGRFQIADGGTIFLDEVGALPVEMQPKLLRVLQEREYERVGDDRTRQVDVRVIAATNRPLADEVRASRFREDLFYRLNVFPLELPPLRSRKEDIPLLAAHIIAKTAKRYRLQEPALTREDIDHLQRYHWPGNIRELQNVLERAVILSKGGTLRFDLALRGAGSVCDAVAAAVCDDDRVLTERECRDIERTNVMKALVRSEGRIYGRGGAAELLEINPATLASRLRALRIEVPRARPCI
jgi:transcriptional regulator with GAF, ATPase, and Fis domain